MNPEFLDYISNIKDGKVSTDSHSYHLGRIPLPVKPDFSNYKSDPQIKNKSFDPSYDLRDEGGLTSVKNQGNCGSCWTFAAMANIESVWKIDGYGTYDLSEQNLHTCNNDFDFGHCNGGNFYMSTAYMAKGIGPVTEADDPYDGDSDSICNSGFTPVKYVTEAIFIPTNETDIKQAILDHGALYTSMYWLSSAYNSGDYTYYYNGPGDGSDGGGGHAVTIVGWDDNKSTASSNDGAWIIKNSWGSYWGESGYFYVSYDDTEINDFVGCYTQSIDYDPQRHIFGYDDYGRVTSYGYSDDGTDYGLVKFSAYDNYSVSKIGTYAMSAGMNLTVTVYDDYSSGTLSNQLATASKSCTNPGYYTLDLSSSFNISTGDRFYVKVKYENGGNFPVPVEKNSSGYLTGATIESGKCWLSSSGGDGSWTAVGGGTSHEIDMCIKAYSTMTVSGNKVTFNVDDGTNPLDGATVSMEGHSDKTTDGSGVAEYTGVSNGSYAYTVSLSGYEQASGSVSVSDADVVENVSLTAATSTYTVTFNVDDGSDPVSGATVSMNGYGDKTTDGSGVAEFTEVSNGDYNYSITHTDFEDENGSLTVADANVTQDVSITPLATSTDFIEADEVKVYPNPANDQVAIECDKDIQKITLLNLQGQFISVKNVQSSNAVLSTDRYAEGIYILQIEMDDNLIVNKRLVIKRD
jgi:C1A family cysteine protease